jgi:glucokinase
VLALDLGGTQIRAAVIEPDGARLARTATPTPSADGPDAVVAACVAALQHVRDAATPAVAADLAGVGISSPGPVDPANGVIVEPPNLGTEFHDIPLAAIVEHALGLPTFLDRDTNVAALGERAFGAGRGVDDFIYLTVSTGVGGGIISGGRPFHGPDGFAGELGHVVIEPDGPICGCGGRGHLEAVASGVALARDARAEVASRRSPYLQQRAATVGADALTARDVADGDAAGDEVCTALMVRARRAIASACVGFVVSFNPHRLIIGGSIAEGQGDRLLGEVRAAIRTGVFPVLARPVEVVAPTLGPDVSLAGAHPLVMHRLPTATPDTTDTTDPVGAARRPAATANPTASHAASA